MSEDVVAELSAALDEIYLLRLALAYEAMMIEGHLGLKTFPRSRRGEAEAQVARMRAAVGSGGEAYRQIERKVMRLEAKRQGFDVLTRAGFAAEVASRNSGEGL